MSDTSEPPDSLDVWVEYVRTRSGMNFDSRRRVLDRCIQERMAVAGCRTPRDYLWAVSAKAGGDGEWDRLHALLLNHETKFFRDPAAFAALRDHVLPELVRQGSGQGIRLWSAGCSNGQEAYSLAMTALDAECCRAESVRVVGTDVSAARLEFATAGRYRRYETTGLGDTQTGRYFNRIGDELQANERLRKHVAFRRHDLTDTGNDRPRADVIFCQNVLIYYAPAVRADIVYALTHSLRPGGYLFLGAGEGLGQSTPGLEPRRFDEAWVYQKTGLPARRAEGSSKPT